MPYRLRRQDPNNYAAFASLAILIASAAVAPGCDDVTARSFGGNAVETGGVSGLSPDGGLARGHGGATAAISVPGTGGTSATDGGVTVPDTPAPEPTGTGGVPVTTPSQPVAGTGGMTATGTGGTAVIGTGGTAPTSVPSGSGGALGTGGALSGTGGVLATGGVQGSGGSPTVPAATGGAGGAMSTGAGGKSGTGAMGGGPGKTMPGSGGSQPPQGDTGGRSPSDTDACAKLISDYDMAVSKGKACDAGAKGATCSKAVPAKLSGCGAGCTTFVDDDSMAKMVQQQWTKAGCMPAACGAEVCVSPTSASCDGEGNKATCTDSLLGV
jgi:hypothetical protein